MRRQMIWKAAGLDGIPYEMYKSGEEVVIDRMTELFNQVWEKERVPRMWNECRMTVAQGSMVFFHKQMKI